jgi:hypothetical protein
MAQNQAFGPLGNTFLVTTNAAANTASAQTVSFNPIIASQPAAQATGLSTPPPQVRVCNTGTSVVYISFTAAAHTAVAPAANPSIDFPVLPGEDVVFTVPQPPTTPNYTLAINTISPGTSVPLLVTFGEGF